MKGEIIKNEEESENSKFPLVLDVNLTKGKYNEYGFMHFIFQYRLKIEDNELFKKISGFVDSMGMRTAISLDDEDADLYCREAEGETIQPVLEYLKERCPEAKIKGTIKSTFKSTAEPYPDHYDVYVGYIFTVRRSKAVFDPKALKFKSGSTESSKPVKVKADTIWGAIEKANEIIVQAEPDKYKSLKEKVLGFYKVQDLEDRVLFEGDYQVIPHGKGEVEIKEVASEEFEARRYSVVYTDILEAEVDDIKTRLAKKT